MLTHEIVVSGRVQGVGFRPFIARIATELNVVGWVRNEGSSVRIVAQQDASKLAIFRQNILELSPPASSPDIESTRTIDSEPFEEFTIIKSKVNEKSVLANLPLDLFTCPECLSEMRDPKNRRFQYPFINCTQCGPRYTLIKQLPYDRPQTSMDAFELCEDCREEYENPLDRRYHAEPIACPTCGPRLHWQNRGESQPDIFGDDALTKAVQLLADNKVVAVKGVGGFHLMANALSYDPVVRVRAIKNRPDKPLAVLFSDNPKHPAYIGNYLRWTEENESLISSVERPIVLLEKRNDTELCNSIAPKLKHVGAMLPYTPLHALLMDRLNFPLVVTSANRQSDPVACTDKECLALDIDGLLGHNRDILYAADDSVYLSRGLPVRYGRGHTPKTLAMPFKLSKPALALGAEDKVTFTLASKNQLVLSPHIGKVSTPASMQFALKTLDHLKAIYNVSPNSVIGDLHPQYAQNMFSNKVGFDIQHRIQHHIAHASAIWFDGWLQKKVDANEDILVFAWDGTGYGADKTLWGGETFYGRPGSWTRVASLSPLRLPGGDKCIVEPWRVAQAIQSDFPFSTVPSEEREIIRQMLSRNLNSPVSHSAGRLLDALGAMLGIERVSFDAYAAMQLNDLAEVASANIIQLDWLSEKNGLAFLDWSPLVSYIAESADAKSIKAALIFRSLSSAIESYVLNHASVQTKIGLTGGVFQSDRLNECLTESSISQRLITHQQLPANDASISVGQIIEYAGRTHV